MTRDAEDAGLYDQPEIAPAHSANFEWVIRMAGHRVFAYEVTCDCGFVCDRHHTTSGAAKCAVNHDRQRSCPPPASVEEVK